MYSDPDMMKDADSKAQAMKPETVTPKKVKTEDQMDLNEEAPHEQDYHLWDLELIRRDANDSE